jgi:ribonucleoside-diphosphate reductase alpha chain
MDYIFRWLSMKFLPDEVNAEVGIVNRSEVQLEIPLKGESEEKRTDQPFKIQDDSPPCTNCGSIMVRSGTCYKCLNCGSTSGCS